MTEEATTSEAAPVATETSAPVAETTTSETSAPEASAPMSEIAQSNGEVSETPDEPVLLAGKYETPEALEQGYTELHKLYNDKVGELPPDNGKYEYSSAFEEAGVSNLVSYEDNPEPYDRMNEMFSTGNFSQDQVNTAIKIGADWIVSEVQRQIPQVDEKAEFAKLEQEWGQQARDKAVEVAKWANANLPSDVFHKPLYASAEGVKFLESLRQQNKGATPITAKDNTPTASYEDIELQVNELMQHPDYYSNSPTGQALQKKVDNLLALQAK